MYIIDTKIREEIYFIIAVKIFLLRILKLVDFFRWSSGGNMDVLNTMFPSISVTGGTFFNSWHGSVSVF
jgi:hypothetical protein